MLPSIIFQKVISPHRICTICIHLVMDGHVYSPTQRKKKKAMMTKSAIACSSGLSDCTSFWTTSVNTLTGRGFVTWMQGPWYGSSCGTRGGRMLGGGWCLHPLLSAVGQTIGPGQRSGQYARQFLYCLDLVPSLPYSCVAMDSKSHQDIESFVVNVGRTKKDRGSHYLHSRLSRAATRPVPWPECPQLPGQLFPRPR
jgi:hypothetical protein